MSHNGNHNGHNGSRGAGPQAGAHDHARWNVRVIVPGLPLQSASVLLSAETPRPGHPRHLVVDTGFPQHDSLIVDGLQRAGVKTEEIDGVINTHYHLDHFGGNFLFPRAWVYGSKADFDWAISIYESVCSGETRREVFRTFYPEALDEEFDRMDEARVLQLLKWMWDPAALGEIGRYRWWEHEALDVDGLRIVPTPGHTPGHLSLAVDGVDDHYLIVGDARPFADDNTPAYDMPPHNHELFESSRQHIDGFAGMLIPGHDDPFSQAGEPAPEPPLVARERA